MFEFNAADIKQLGLKTHKSGDIVHLMSKDIKGESVLSCNFLTCIWSGPNLALRTLCVHGVTGGYRCILRLFGGGWHIAHTVGPQFQYYVSSDCAIYVLYCIPGQTFILTTINAEFTLTLVGKDSPESGLGLGLESLDLKRSTALAFHF